MHQYIRAQCQNQSVQIYRTTTCANSGHPEFTVVFRGQPPTPNAVGWILDYLEQAVTEGIRFTLGQTGRVAWRLLRVIARGDGTLGLEERVAQNVWEEHVDKVFDEAWNQMEAAEKLGLSDDMDIVGEERLVAVQPCAFEATTITLHRVEPDPPDSYVWALVCGDEHEHEDWNSIDLFALSTELPFVTQFLALPPKTNLLIDRDNVTVNGGVLAHVSRNNAVLTPDEGMYFGPEPPPRPSPISAHCALADLGGGLYRTTIGPRCGHPDIVARLTEPPIPGLDDPLISFILDDLPDGMDAGNGVPRGPDSAGGVAGTAPSRETRRDARATRTRR